MGPSCARSASSPGSARSTACATSSAQASDEGVNALFNEAAVFAQTSTHEGFCLPPLGAIATGGAVVCTDSHGNRDFCVDGENCLMPAAGVEAVSAAVARLLGDAGLRERLGAAGSVTAQEYAGSGGSTRWRGSWRGWGGTQRTGCSLTARRDC